jgi:hypothetical protein
MNRKRVLFFEMRASAVKIRKSSWLILKLVVKPLSFSE